LDAQGKLKLKIIIVCIALLFPLVSFAEKGPEYQLIDEESLKPIMAQLVSQLSVVLIQANPKLQGVEEVMNQFFEEAGFLDFLVEKSAKSHRDNFTTAELEELVVFWESPLGKKYAAYGMDTLRQNGDIQEFMTQNRPLMMRLIEEHMSAKPQN